MDNKPKEEKPATKLIEVEGATQDEALANAREVAEEEGYEGVSLQNTIMVRFTAMLHTPVKEEEPEEEKAEEDEQEAE